MQIWLNDHIKENYGRDASLIYYDVTNYYFETDEQTDFLRKVSKEHRPNPIVQMGLFMNNQGIPFTYEFFPGNTNDCLTYRPNFGRIKKQFNLGRVISVADKGMTTGDNIWYTINTPTHDGYVFSISIRGAEKSIKDYVLEQEGYEWLGTEYKRKSRKSPRTIQVSSVSGKKIKKQVDEKQVVFWSEKYAKRAKAEREAHFLTCFVALIIARILENKMERKYSIGTILESLSKAECSLIQQNYYLFDYYDEVLKDIGRVTDIDFGKRIRTLGEIKKALAKTKK